MTTLSIVPPSARDQRSFRVPSREGVLVPLERVEREGSRESFPQRSRKIAHGIEGGRGPPVDPVTDLSCPVRGLAPRANELADRLAGLLRGQTENLATPRLLLVHGALGARTAPSSSRGREGSGKYGLPFEPLALVVRFSMVAKPTLTTSRLICPDGPCLHVG